MRVEERDPAHLWDMLEAARSVVEFIGESNLDEFISEGQNRQITRLAVERQLEVLGEAARRISPSFRDKHGEVPWKEIVGLRNVISHQYDKVNYAEIYRIVQGRIPPLIVLLEPLVPPPPESPE